MKKNREHTHEEGKRLSLLVSRQKTKQGRKEDNLTREVIQLPILSKEKKRAYSQSRCDGPSSPTATNFSYSDGGTRIWQWG